jgi:1,5-anhydro-D-fructose reductase (1,5-anhydro-D-mannitol-forming)
MTGWGLIGASNIARQYMIAAIRAQPGHEIAGVLSSNPERGAAFAREQGIPRAAATLDELLADPAVACVYISTTNDRHHDQAIAAIKAGKHVLCEKPLALDLRGARGMIETARDAGVTFATNHHLRNAGLHRRMRDLVREGALGQVLAVRIFHAVHLPPALQGWRVNNAAAGGGVVLDITVHDADTVRFVLGDDPVEVTAFTASQGMGVEGLADGVMGVMRMRSGALVQFHDAFTVGHVPTGFEVIGTHGALVARNCMTQNPVGELALRRDGTETPIDDFDRGGLYTRSVANFAAAGAGTGEPSASGEDGLWSLATALAVQQSAESGCAVPVTIGP